MQLEITALNLVLFTFCYFVFLMIVILLHEGLHIVMFKWLKIPYYMKWLKTKKLPLAWAIYSPYFNSKFKDMSSYKQFQYIKVAVFPYLFILPMCFYLMTFKEPVIFIMGVCFAFANLLNFPLEFVYIHDKDIKKDIK